jgi:hypothetical protein
VGLDLIFWVLAAFGRRFGVSLGPSLGPSCKCNTSYDLLCIFRCFMYATLGYFFMVVWKS